MAVGPTIEVLRRSWRLSLEAQNKSPRTISQYLDSLRLFEAFLTATGMPVVAGSITREHVEAFLADLLTRAKPATAATRYKCLKLFFDWCAEEGEIAESPMRNMTRARRFLSSRSRCSATPSCGRAPEGVRGSGLHRAPGHGAGRCSCSTPASAGASAPASRSRTSTCGVKAGHVSSARAAGHATVAFGAKTARALDRYLRVAEPSSGVRRLGLLLAGPARSAVGGRHPPGAGAPRSGRRHRRACTPTASATPSPTPGSQRAATRAT